ncbi:MULTISPECIES: C-terminal binding protein [unclassified Pseudarthrobacter]|uniref:C-terminal binding protein n=1 Tax=unclassified Pseudarthrobacter TaxID=2647000 RepID=UPI00307861A0
MPESAGTRPVVVFTDREHDDLAIERAILAEIDAEVIDLNGDLDGFAEVAARADAVCNQYTDLGPDRIAQLGEKCGVISHYGIGVNRIDVEAATARGIFVANAPTYCTEEVAYHAVALLLSLERAIVPYERQYREDHRWSYHTEYTLHRISTRTLGLVGYGRTAREVARIGRALGYGILAYDPVLSAEFIQAEGATPVATVGELFERSDAVSLHVPLTPETRNMVNDEVLSRARPGLRLVNTSRGAVIDEAALRTHLESGRVIAGLDVIANEPPSFDDPILSAPGTVTTPHVAFYSEEAYMELRETVARNVVAFIRTGAPFHSVNRVAEPATTKQ